jgi:hypothetical protein
MLRGTDLATNLEFHFGLVNYFLSQGVYAKPTTKFVVPYLTLIGELKREANGLDLDYAFDEIGKRRAGALAPAGKDAVAAAKKIYEQKETLLERPIMKLFEEPHFLAAWLCQHRLDFTYEGDRIVWNKNPLCVLADTYHLLHMDDQPGAPAAHVIWAHDQAELDRALGFYERLAKHVPEGTSWASLDTTLRGETPAFGFDADTWAKVRAAHAGHQLGLEILALLPLVAKTVGFYDLRVNDDLTITIPERLHDPAHQTAMRKVLVPPPATKADEIVAVSGGMFYGQEAPDRPVFVTKGAHVKAGDPLYIVEVMKMFNKVYAPLRVHHRRDRRRGRRHDRPEGPDALQGHAGREARRRGPDPQEDARAWQHGRVSRSRARLTSASIADVLTHGATIEPRDAADRLVRPELRVERLAVACEERLRVERAVLDRGDEAVVYDRARVAACVAGRVPRQQHTTNRVLELTHVARPRVALAHIARERGHDLVRERSVVMTDDTRDERRRQRTELRGRLGDPRTQRRHLDHVRREPVVEVIAQCARRA